MSSKSKWVYLFDEVEQAENYVGGDWDAVRGLLGGKGANLAEMVRIGIPVPPGFTVTTEACNAYLSAGENFPAGMWEQVLEALKAVETASGKKFGDAKNPLLDICGVRNTALHDPYVRDVVSDNRLARDHRRGSLSASAGERSRKIRDPLFSFRVHSHYEHMLCKPPLPVRLAYGKPERKLL